MKIVFIQYAACDECFGAGTVHNYDSSNGQTVVGHKEWCRVCLGLGAVRKVMTKKEVLEAAERMESPS